MADKLPTAPKGAADDKKGLLSGAVDKVMELFAPDLSTALAAVAVPRKKFATKLAELIKKHVSKDSFLLGDTSETIIELVSNRVEQVSKKMKSEGKGELVEACSDFLSDFGTALCGDDRIDPSKSAKPGAKPATSGTPPGFTKTHEALAESARKRLEKAGKESPEKLKAAEACIRSVVQAQVGIEKLLTEGPKEKAPRAKKVKPLTDAEKAEAAEKEAKQWPNRVIAGAKKLLTEGKETWKKGNDALSAFNDQQAIRIAQIKATRKATPPSIPTPRNGIIDRALTSSLRGVGRFLGVCR